MTTKTEALKLALEALMSAVGTCFDYHSYQQVNSQPTHFMNQARIAIEEALAQPEQEPVAWMHDAEGRVDVIHSEVKALWIKVGQPNGFYREKVPCKVEHYTIPLYAACQVTDDRNDDAIIEINKALVQPTEQEPVGQLREEAYGRGQVLWFKKLADRTLLYTSPPQEPRSYRPGVLTNFCSRCGKRLGIAADVHTCTPPPPRVRFFDDYGNKIT